MTTVGRLLTDAERRVRAGAEDADHLDDEQRRTAFAISSRHLLTAWHAVRDLAGGRIWFRVRPRPDRHHYAYLPVRVTNVAPRHDVAALAVDVEALDDPGDVEVTAEQAAELLGRVAIRLDGPGIDGTDVRVVGFADNMSAAEATTYEARLVEARHPFRDVTAATVQVPSLGTTSPVDPHGLSGSPVLAAAARAGQTERAVAIVRATPTGDRPDQARGAMLVATGLFELADVLPEIAALQPTRLNVTEATVDGRAMVDLPEIVERSAAALRDACVHTEDETRGPLTGWSHFLDDTDEAPTAIGTAYGLKLDLLLGGARHLLDRAALAETIWKLRREDGGWCSRTGHGHSQPEVTALCLSALYESGFGHADREEARDRFAAMLEPGYDPTGMENVHVVTGVLRALAQLPGDEDTALQAVAGRLLNGSIAVGDELTAWATTLANPRTGDLEPVPDVVSTAKAVVALVRAEAAREQPTALWHSTVRAATNWLVRWVPTDGCESEQIRRRFGAAKDADLVNVDHYRPAWVARALLAAREFRTPEADRVLDEAVAMVAAGCGPHGWENRGTRPIWMTYQGVGVLLDHARRTGSAT